MNRGIFITFEGLDGSGKTTQAQLLLEYLQRRGCEAIFTREPGGTPVAEEIRRVILTPTPERLAPMAEILLYAASRAQHVENLIKPALKSGKIVISDRFTDSSIAYQGYGLGWDPALILQVNQLAVGGVEPDLTFLIDVETKQALGRIKQITADRIELRDLIFHQKVREGFLKLQEANCRFVKINAGQKTIEMIHDEIITILKSRLNL